MSTAVIPRSARVAGWTAVALSTVLACFWAYWGAIENFHEGWYYPKLWQNLALMFGQYLPGMLVPMIAAAIAIPRPRLGFAVHCLAAAGFAWRFGVTGGPALVLAAVPALLGVLYLVGRPVPRRRALRIVIGLPLVTAVAAGAYPASRVLTRPDTVDLSMRRIAGNGVDLVWAPAGPGWPDDGFDWAEAERRCAHLSDDGLSLADAPLDLWRLPTVDEVVRTMTWRGENAGGAWDAEARRVSWRVQPDKEAPLWNPRSKVIYWWTADRADENRAFRVVYNGQVHAMSASWGPGYMACRCVRRD